MNLENKIRNIKSFNDFDSTERDIETMIRVSVQKLKFRKLALQYMLNPLNIIDTVLTETSARIIAKLGRWFGKF